MEFCFIVEPLLIQNHGLQTCEIIVVNSIPCRSKWPKYFISITKLVHLILPACHTYLTVMILSDTPLTSHTTFFTLMSTLWHISTICLLFSLYITHLDRLRPALDAFSSLLDISIETCLWSECAAQLEDCICSNSGAFKKFCCHNRDVSTHNLIRWAFLCNFASLSNLLDSLHLTIGRDG